MWKMRRLRKNTQTKVVLTRYDLRNPAFDEKWGLLRFIACLRSEPEIEEPETCFEQKASSYLRPDKIDYLKRKFPRSEYKSTSEWVNAITTEIFAVLIPAIPSVENLKIKESDLKEAARELKREVAALDDYKEALRQWNHDCLLVAMTTYASDVLEYELKQGELLEARIQRKIKFLVELKTMEQMLGQR
jgi:hypothetical protein